MTIETKECVESICNWVNENHDSFPHRTGYIGNYYSSGKKASHWKRRGVLKKDDLTMRVFERTSGAEEIKPTTIVVDLPEEFIVTFSTKDKFIKLEAMSVDNITQLGIKVATSFGGYFNCDKNGKLVSVKEVENTNKILKCL